MHFYEAKSGAHKSGEGCFLGCLLHTSSGLLRGIGVSRTAALLRAHLAKPHS